MAFLDNSGDIILDAVLTDEGRMRLAKGNFQITHFAFGDDEIDYTNFDATTGSAYMDLEIMQTPVFEAFTNNASSMNSKLMTVTNTRLLYLPILELNEQFAGTSTARHTNGNFNICVTEETEDLFSSVTGILDGFTLDDGKYVRVDQGIDSSDVPASAIIDPELNETQYMIDIDNRLGSIVSAVDGTAARVNFIDDDGIARYYLTQATAGNFVIDNDVFTESPSTQVIAGSRGTILQFRIKPSIDLTANDALFNRIGSTVSVESTSVKNIDAFVRVTGVTTGYRLDIPVRFIRKP
tara:strand:+ start:659 stop:1543 length:885 start_codon:yes stop_codon:yes gene_type:complete